MAESITPSEMLSIYMDGELDEQSTSSLFYMMAQNPELQTEMQQLMALRTATTSASLQVPAHLKSSVLMQTVGSNNGKATSGFVSTLGLMVGAAAIASISTAWYFLSDSGNGSDNAMSDKLTTQQVERTALTDKSNGSSTQNSADIGNSHPEIHDKTSHSANALTRSTRTITTSSSLQKGDIVSDESPTIHDIYAQTLEQEVPSTENEISQTDVSINRSALLQPSYGMFNGRFPSVQPQFAQLTESTISNDDLNTIEVSYRGITPASFQNTSLQAPSEPFGNMGVTVFYTANETSSFGLEAGYDKWVQTYKGQEGDTSVQYEQHYTAFSMGLAYRHLFTSQEWLSGAQPYLQGGLGATAVGPMGKLAFGLRYPLLSNISVSAGFEASVLAYEYKGSVFSSQRAGFVYSINIGL